MSEERTHQGISRRSFLKTSAAAAGVAAIGGASMTTLAAGAPSTASGEQKFWGICRPNCECSCRLSLTVRDGKLVKVEAGAMPNPDYDRICLKGLTHVTRTYEYDRVLYPLKRKEGTERGAGEWERITWDEAITTITDHWKKTQAQYGNSAVMFMLNEGNYGVAGHETGYVRRLANCMQVVAGAGTFDLNVTLGFMYTIGFQYYIYWNHNEWTDWKNARHFFVWGANLPDSHPQSWHFIQKAKEGGTKLWYIDPRFNNGAAKADEYITIRPGSDTIALLAMMKIIIENDWIDHEFTEQHTNAPFLVKQTDGFLLRDIEIGLESADYVVIDEATGEPMLASECAKPAIMGQFNVAGIPVKTALQVQYEQCKEWTPAKAEEYTTIPAAKIEEMARVYALDGPCMIFTLFGVDRWYNAVQFGMAMAAIAGITHNISRPGACIGEHCLYGYLNGGGINSPTGTANSTINAPECVDVIATGMYRGQPHPVKSLWAYCSNFVGNWDEQDYWVETLKDQSKLELIAVSDFRLTDSARYADIVLPAAGWFEVWDATGNGTHPYGMIQEKAIEPLGESRSDIEVIQEFARRMGFGQYFTDDAEEYVKNALLTHADCIRLGVTLDKMKANGGICRIIDGSDEHPYIYAEGGIFPTASGRLEMYVEYPYSLYADPNFRMEDYHVAHWMEPIEAWHTNPLYQKYPLVMLQEHAKWRMHTQWSHEEILRELDPEPIIYMCPQDMAARGIKNHDYVRAFNDRGSVVLKCIEHKGMTPGVTNMPRGWQRDQHLNDTSYQALTHRKVTPASGNQNCFDTLIQVEKFEGSVK